MDNLSKCGANFAQLSPMTFLPRAAAVYGNRTSIVYGTRTRFTWAQTHDRCVRLASALRTQLGVVKNDVVSVLAPNVPAMYEMHFAVPMAGAVLNTVNTRLGAKGIAAILKHAEAKVLFVDYEYVHDGKAMEVLSALANDPEITRLPAVILIDDVDRPTGTRFGDFEYEELLVAAPEASTLLPPVITPEDEWDAIALNYTSGTTSATPKGVVYSHRGAYLSTLTLLLQWGVGGFPVYMWSLPMFHCNGWTFTWGVAARGGTNVCIRTTSAAEMYSAIDRHRVTHMCCAPVIFNILLEATPSERRTLPVPVHVLTGGAPPPAARLEEMEGLGFRVTHAYGLTEGTGPALVCEWQPEWDALPAAERAGLKARQGVSVLTLADVDVKDADTMASVPRDGNTMGEIVLRGSSIMKGYFKNEKATAEAFPGNREWFVTGDVGVVHDNGYVEIRDRSKDIIISGGENISSVEVEGVLFKNPKILEAAVVAMPHPRWGETPCAFVVLKKGEVADESEIIQSCRGKMAGFMVPKKVVFLEALPRNGNNKVVKFELRAKAKAYKIADNCSATTTQQRKDRKKPVVTDENSNNGRGVVVDQEHHRQQQPHVQFLARSRL